MHLSLFLDLMHQPRHPKFTSSVQLPVAKLAAWEIDIRQEFEEMVLSHQLRDANIVIYKVG